MSTRSKSKQTIPIPAPASSTSPNGRLFTDSDEIRLLKIFYEYTKSNPSSTPSSSSAPITLNFQAIQRINKALNSNFTHSQISAKLRRLRVKYHKQARSKSLIRTPHDHHLFNLARKIWGKKTKPKPKHNNKVGDSVSSQDDDNEGVGVAGNGQVDSEDYPALVSEFSRYLPVNSVLKEGLKMLGTDKLREMNDRWMSIGIEEAKIVAKKAELVKEQTQLLMQVLEHGSGN